MIDYGEFWPRTGAPYYKKDNWYVSPLNFSKEITTSFSFPQHFHIHDVTLRDGEQTPGVRFRADEKVFLAKALDEIGIQSIEVGLSPQKETAKAMKELSKIKLNAKLMLLVRLLKSDIDIAVDCGANGVVVEYPINPYLIKHVWNKSPEEIIEDLIQIINYAKSRNLYVNFMGWEAFRTSISYIKYFFTKVVDGSHPDAVTIADTFGMAHPLTTMYVIRKMKEWFSNIDVELHIHNDYGLATAGAIAAVTAGANGVHSSINGLGERSGNVATEEVVVALEALFDFRTGIIMEGLYRLSRIISEISKQEVGFHKPIVGDKVFDVESGLRIDATIKLEKAGEQKHNYYAFNPKVIGREDVKFRVGTGSGKSGIKYLLDNLGIAVTEDELNQILDIVRSEGTILKAYLFDGDLEKIAAMVKKRGVLKKGD